MLFALELSLSGSRRDTTREFLSLETALNRVGFAVQSHIFPENPTYFFISGFSRIDLRTG